MSPPSSRQRRRSASRFTLADQARGVIKDRDLSDSELARRAGVARSQVTRFMRGERGLTLDTFDALCEVLGLRLAEAGGRRGGRRGANASAADPMDRESEGLPVASPGDADSPLPEL